jgi:putative resolvase
MTVPIKLSEYARKKGITYRTAWRIFKSGKMKNAEQLPSGTIVVHVKEKSEPDEVIESLVELKEIIETLIKERTNVVAV